MKNADHLCELLSPVEPHQALDLVRNPRYCMQVKEDGERLMVDTSFGARIGFDRKNQITALSPALLDQLKDLPDDCFLDGELVNGYYFPFDLLRCDGESIAGRSYAERLQLLAALPIDVVPTWYDDDKASTLLRLHEEGAEGVCFKDLLAAWQPGRAQQHYKLKFWESASCRVADKALRSDRRDDKHSVALELLDADGAWRAMGFVTIPNSMALPRVGEIVEVRYLYAQADGLYQGVFLAERRDLDYEDCRLAQLKWKVERGAYV